MLENKTVPTIPVFLFNKALVDRSVKNTPTYKLQHRTQARQQRKNQKLWCGIGAWMNTDFPKKWIWVFFLFSLLVVVVVAFIQM